MTQWAKKLETASGPDFQILLDQIKLPVYVDESLLKNELSLLVAKIMKLLRSTNSPQEYYQIWKGCHAAVIIASFNPLVLVAHGGQLLTGIYNKLEQLTDYINTQDWTIEFDTLLSTLVSSLTILMDLMRGNPTLSRESLVPKLKAIIPTLIKLTESKPLLSLPVLAKLLYKHSTTFKPFINKYRAALENLLSSKEKYNQFDTHLKKLICKNYAYLHLIKSNNNNNNADNNNNHVSSHPDENWRLGLFSVLRQYQPLFKLFHEILDMDQDEQLKVFINGLPMIKTEEGKETNDTTAKLFGKSLKLDLNEPFTLYEIVNRINLLNDLLIAFITLPTPFAIRVPIKLVNNIAEILMGLNTKYLTIKRELRHDQELTTIIEDVLIKLQSQSVRIWLNMLQTYGKQCLTIIPNIINSMSVFIPFKPKSNKLIDYSRCDQVKHVFGDIFKVINLCFPHLGHQLNTELDSLTKLIDVSLYLVEDKSLLEPFYNLQKKQKMEKNTNKSQQQSKSKKSNKDSNGALSDLYTHSMNFDISVNLKQHDEINQFLYNIINNWKLSSFLQIKITKYAINKSIYYKQLLTSIPESFVKLLRIIVINPGFERVSILPIAVSLLNEQCDDVFDTLCHPRLPLGIVYSIMRKSNNMDAIEDNFQPIDEVSLMEQEEEEAREEEEEEKEGIAKEDVDVKIGLKEDNETEEAVSTNDVDETKVFKRDRDEAKQAPSSKRVKINDTVEAVEFSKDEPSASVSQEQAKVEESEESDDNDDDEDFVIPDIELSDDDE